MDETRKTLAFVAAAAVVTAAAFLAAPADPTPEAFSDRGEAFFPEFVDPNDAVSLEVIDFDEATGGINAFSVVFKGTRWRIPSHHNYPADDKDRLARTAAGLIEVRKDDVVAEIAADHEALGVVDPLDESVASLSGRGKRVTIKDGNDNLLADLIVGGNVPGREGQYRYLRVPGQKRTYAARFDVDVSSRFGDWIEKDLLEVDQARIGQVILKDYSIDEGTRMLDQRDTIVLSKGDPDWTANRMRTGQKVDAVKMEDLLKALDELTIVGVRPKPAGLSRSLENNDEGISITRSDLASLQQKGYYFTGDGQLVSNEGETQVSTEDGIIYTLRFGEIVYGAGDEVTAGLVGAGSAGSEGSPGGLGGAGGSGGPGGFGAGSPAGPGENRYLFITTGFDAGLFPEPPGPADLGFQARADSLWTDADRTNADLYEKHEAWRQRVDTGRRTSADLNARFAQWYYVISAESFDRIRLRRADLVTSE
ncbi:MAG: DUF4340 domain-containing protein [Gemmatimonadetes bacterium]|nr:DUF4340 domain-containing protein [Gemmatimonadota bacterium]